MDRHELATMLAQAAPASHQSLLTQYAPLADVDLAQQLRATYYAAIARDPSLAAGTVAALTTLSMMVDEPVIAALADWVGGLARLQIDGQMAEALAQLDAAIAQFTAIGDDYSAAAVQVGRLIALAMLGSYDEAITSGETAAAVFVAHGDRLSAAKIGQNLGNISQRRDRYHEAEQYYRAARDHYLALGDQQQLAQIDNCLGLTLTSLHRFREAERCYAEALGRAEALGLEKTQAEIESDLGALALLRGNYARSLDYRERARRRYQALDLTHETALAEHELAETYLELNLMPEAVAITGRVAPTFAALGMRAEQARALAAGGRALAALGRGPDARILLDQARALYFDEGNPVGAMLVTLTEIQLLLDQGELVAAADAARIVAASLATSGAESHWLLAEWLHGEALRRLGRCVESRVVLERCLAESTSRALPQLIYRSLTSLGLVARAEGDRPTAEAVFVRAIDVLEALRAPLPAEEFRLAFVADKLTPYTELVRLCLADATPERLTEALSYIERARARALVELLDGAVVARPHARDDYETDLLEQSESLRAELNRLYTLINRPAKGLTASGPAWLAELQTAVRDREAELLTITRQVQQRGEVSPRRAASLDVAAIQTLLGQDSALVEYFSLDGALLALVVTNDGITVVPALADEAVVEQALSQLQFQFETLRFGAERLHDHLELLTARAVHYLGRLYELLLRPIEPLLGQRRLVVVPYRRLHYVPFQALYDGGGHVIERREVVVAPSATVLQQCCDRPRGTLQRALFMAVADAQTPHVRDEVAQLAPLFAEAKVFLDERATLDALRTAAPAADLIHIACHGQFRADNPLFSSVRLADGWLTVRDTYELELSAELVTLSACETGVSAIAPGDDLIGLARGFFSAGVPSLVVSLWTVDDASTARLMTTFYRHLRAGETPSAALRQAQCAMLTDRLHPYFWAPFTLVGRW